MAATTAMKSPTTAGGGGGMYSLFASPLHMMDTLGLTGESPQQQPPVEVRLPASVGPKFRLAQADFVREEVRSTLVLTFTADQLSRPFVLPIGKSTAARAAMDRERYRWHVDDVQLLAVRASGTGCSPNCMAVLSFDHALLRTQGYSTGSELEEPVSAVLFAGNDPTPLPLHLTTAATRAQSLALSAEDRERAYRYGCVESAAELLAAVPFDDAGGYLLPPPHITELPQLVTTWLKNNPTTKAKTLRRDDFTTLCRDIDDYVMAHRRRFMYAHQPLSGALRVTEPCTVVLHFAVQLAHLYDQVIQPYVPAGAELGLAPATGVTPGEPLPKQQLGGTDR